MGVRFISLGSSTKLLILFSNGCLGSQTDIRNLKCPERLNRDCAAMIGDSVLRQQLLDQSAI